MTVSSGFFNSVSGDRKYNARHFNEFFDGLICDGVYVNVGDAFEVTPGTGMQVIVGTGRGWFNNTWILNDAALPLNLASADPILSRIDAIVIDINTGDSVRNNDIIYKQGTAATSPDKPSLINEATHKQYALAWILVSPGVTTITAEKITNGITAGDIPAVEALLEYSSRTKAEIDARFERDEKPVFTESQTEDNIASGETIFVIFGKIQKFINIIKGKLPVKYGGTGQNTHTVNSVLLGNGTSAIKNKATANGAFYATSANGAPVFGTLPIEQGGTGQTSAYNAYNSFANSLEENTGNFVDNDTLLVKKETATNSKYYFRVKLSKITDYVKSKFTNGIGLVYSNGTYKLKLKSETKLSRDAVAAADTANRVYPVQLDKSGDPAVVVPWTDNNTNNAVTQNSVGTSDTNEYRVLLSNSANDNNETASSKKNSALKYKPSTGNLQATSFNDVKLAKSDNNYGYYDANGNFKTFRQPTGNATAAQVVSGYTFANASSDSLTGTFAPQEKTVTSSRSAQTVTPDSGKYLSKVTVNALVPSGTYKPTARATGNDMGAAGNYRYVDTTAVPNTNSGTYTYPSGNTGGTVDLGATNTYRYVNAGNVYSSGRSQGQADIGSNGLVVVSLVGNGSSTKLQLWVGKYGQSLSQLTKLVDRTISSDGDYDDEFYVKTNYSGIVGK